MRRNVSTLVEREYDIVIIGGGIFGVCAAWDAALRGLSVALIEKGDFAHATSANCFKMVHGGIRYLQHGDLIRIRESSKERNILLRIAPHLVQPLPIVIPTYGHGMKGKEILGIGISLYDFITADRNAGIRDPARRIPRGHFISREDVLKLFPELEKNRLTGAAVIHDGQMYSAPRLAISFLKSATLAGAEAANYVEAIKLCRHNNRVCGVTAKDRLTGDDFRIRAKVVLNAAGPWAEHFLKCQDLQLRSAGTYSRDTAFIVRRRLPGKYALAVPARTSDPDAILSRQNRHLFLVPWRDYTLVGVWHVVHQGDPDDFTVEVEELQSFIDEVNHAYAGVNLKVEDVLLCNAGLVLFGNNQPGTADLSYGKRSRIIDHGREHSVEGLITLVGVRYTTARLEASRAIDLAVKKLGKRADNCLTPTMPIYGARFESFEKLAEHAVKDSCLPVQREAMHGLLHNHGSEYPEVLRCVEDNPAWGETLGTSTTIRAEVIHAVREEMAQKLGDVVFRRTDLATGSYPGDAALRASAELMASELGWSSSRIRNEVEEVIANFSRCPVEKITKVASSGQS